MGGRKILSYKDLTGMKFGRLTVVKRQGTIRGHVTWFCVCECGNTTVVESSELQRKADEKHSGTKSCGCLSRELSSERINQRFPDKFHKDRLYTIWACMNHRCTCKTANNYKYYGGRGIQVCDEWKTNYPAFKKWAYENGYDENAPRGKCTLDRINVDGNYEPDNCRWVDMKTQVNNRRSDIHGNHKRKSKEGSEGRPVRPGGHR